MSKTVSLGVQDFAYIRENNCFFVDKTDFIRKWWENKDSVTLITRPRRFGKNWSALCVDCSMRHLRATHFWSVGCLPELQE